MAGGVFVAGVGFRAACPAGDIVGAVRAAEAACGVTVGALAVPGFKDGPVARAAGVALGVPVRVVGDGALAAVQDACPTRSAVVRAAVGHGSVAEAAALAGSGGVLRLPRIVFGQATCAVAEGA